MASWNTNHAPPQPLPPPSPGGHGEQQQQLHPGQYPHQHPNNHTNHPIQGYPPAQPQPQPQQSHQQPVHPHQPPAPPPPMSGATGYQPFVPPLAAPRSSGGFGARPPPPPPPRSAPLPGTLAAPPAPPPSGFATPPFGSNRNLPPGPTCHYPPQPARPHPPASNAAAPPPTGQYAAPPPPGGQYPPPPANGPNNGRWHSPSTASPYPNQTPNSPQPTGHYPPPPGGPPAAPPAAPAPGYPVPPGGPPTPYSAYGVQSPPPNGPPPNRPLPGRPTRAPPQQHQQAPQQGPPPQGGASRFPPQQGPAPGAPQRKQTKSKIDPSQIPRIPCITTPTLQPRPIYKPASILPPQTTHSTYNPKPKVKETITLSDVAVPPAAWTRCKMAVDENCSPDILRPTTHFFPRSRGIKDKTGIPLHVLCTPFGDHSHSTQTSNIQTLEMDSGFNPCKCDTCSAYLNPGAEIHPGGFTCNFCNTKNFNKRPTVPGALNPLLVACPRVGVVDHVVRGDYIQPRKNEFGQVLQQEFVDYNLYAIDVAADMSALDGIAKVAETLSQQGSQFQTEYTETYQKHVPIAHSRIGICLVHATGVTLPYYPAPRTYNTGEAYEEDVTEEPKLEMVELSDIEEPFNPLPVRAWTVDVTDTATLSKLCDAIREEVWPHLVALNAAAAALTPAEAAIAIDRKPTTGNKSVNEGTNCGGAALQVMADALQSVGGRVTLIAATRPRNGIGKLRNRDISATNYSRPYSEQSLRTPLQHHKLNKHDPRHSINKLGCPNLLEDAKSKGFYKNLASNCQKNKIAIDIVITDNNHSASLGGLNMEKPDNRNVDNDNDAIYLDVATLGELCRATCGNLKCLRASIQMPGQARKFLISRNMRKEYLRNELVRSATRISGKDAIFKLRCSSGLRVKSFHGLVPGNIIDDDLTVGGNGNSSPELEMPTCSVDTCISVAIDYKIGGIPKDQSMVYFQGALLYTCKRTGRRLIRIMTLSMRVTDNPADVYRGADLGVLAAVLIRSAIWDAAGSQKNDYDPESVKGNEGSSGRISTLQTSRDIAVDTCVEILSCYRLYTSAKKSPPAQLVLPESLQLLPLLILSLRKSSLLRPALAKGLGYAQSPSPTCDDRCFQQHYAMNVSPAVATLLVHPNVYCLTSMESSDGTMYTPSPVDMKNRSMGSSDEVDYEPYIRLPHPIHPSMSCLNDDGIHLIDDGFSLYLLVGNRVSGEKRNQLFATTNSNTSHNSDCLDISTTSDFGEKVGNIIHQLRTFHESRFTYAPLVVLSDSLDSTVHSHTPTENAIESSSNNSYEGILLNLLVDDPTSHEKGYVDFLCSLHRQIRNKVMSETYAETHGGF